MSLSFTAKDIQTMFVNNGYIHHNELYNIKNISKNKLVNSCHVIAKKENFLIIYVDVKSNWRSITTELISKNNNICLIITHVAKNHYVFSTSIHVDGIQKFSHVIINDSTRQNILKKFIIKMRIKQEDTDVDAKSTIQKAFTEFDIYRQAIDEFAENLNHVISDTRNMINTLGKSNLEYNKAQQKFLKICKVTISDKITFKEITEMLIQHIITYGIFMRVYGEHNSHKINSLVGNLNHLVELLGMSPETVNVNHTTIKMVAESITENKDRQELLKKVYEIFYEKYNRNAADIQGIVYTPFEIVDFMIKFTDDLLEKHFNSSLSKKNVRVLDPATGTGTFVSHILEYIDKDNLESKYKNDLFVNDISILSYYVATLNIENTFKKRAEKSREFTNISWADTLDTGVSDLVNTNTWSEGRGTVKGISKLNDTVISVIIGNPPYNAMQVSYNDNNAAKKYPKVDERIRETFVKNGLKKSKNTQYDMYKRFLRWSIDSMGKTGIIAFVSNNSFLKATSDDGFRKVMAEEFDHIYTINLKGNGRLSGEARRKEGEKIFGQKARVGISLSFFIKTGKKKKDDLGEIHYSEVADYLKIQEKFKWLKDNSFDTLEWESIVPDKNNTWLNQTNDDFGSLIPLISDDGKSVFRELTMGCMSGRDDWTYDFNGDVLKEKIIFFIKLYNKFVKEYKNNEIKISGNKINYASPNIKNKDSDFYKIKQSDDTLKNIQRTIKLAYSDTMIKKSIYRPFVEKYQYFDKIITHRIRKFDRVFYNSGENKLLCFSNPDPSRLFRTLATNKITDCHVVGDAQCIPLLIYGDVNKRQYNITKYVLELFQKYYNDNKITNKDIFYYVYAIFNDVKYEKKYRYSLQREFPRVPLAKDFKKWTKIGHELFTLHAKFHDVEEYPLETIVNHSNKNKTSLQLKKTGKKYSVILDGDTTLDGIPTSATEYMLGPKCALEWVLEFYKENKNKMSEKSSNNKKIRDKFSVYNFADHREYVISLLKKVTTISVKTVELKEKLEKMEWGKQPNLGFKTKEKIKNHSKSRFD